MSLVAPLKRLIDAPIDAFGRFARSFNPYVPEELQRDGMEPVRIEESSIKKQSGKIIGITFIAFLVWAFTAPLDSGAVVNGSVVAQHPAMVVIEVRAKRSGAVVKRTTLTQGPAGEVLTVARIAAIRASVLLGDDTLAATGEIARTQIVD